MNRAGFCFLATAILLLPLALTADDTKSSNSSGKMTPQTKLLVMRDLQAERVFVQTPFPLGERDSTSRTARSAPTSRKWPSW